MISRWNLQLKLRWHWSNQGIYRGWMHNESSSSSYSPLSRCAAKTSLLDGAFCIAKFTSDWLKESDSRFRMLGQRSSGVLSPSCWIVRVGEMSVGAMVDGIIKRVGMGRIGVHGPRRRYHLRCYHCVQLLLLCGWADIGGSAREPWLWNSLRLVCRASRLLNDITGIEVTTSNLNSVASFVHCIPSYLFRWTQI